MINIALIGYGKMGKEIEKVAQERGHTIISKLSHTPTMQDIQLADVAIEFTRPEMALENITLCINASVPVVCGTTGWLDKISEVEKLVIDKNGSFIYASNFSLGVNLFLEMTRKLAKMMQPYPNYLLELEEIHHTEKRDAPSGTAITIAETIIAQSDYINWSLDGASNENSIPIFSKRIDTTPGTHSIKYISEEDEIHFTHIAKSRRGFALGAVLAAEFIYNKKGIFTMKDVLGIS